MPGRLTATEIQGMCRPDVPPDEAARTIAEFEAAVDEGRLGRGVDPVWPLSVASRLAEDAGDLDEALRLQERVLGYDDVFDELARRAMILVRLGRRAEGVAAFEALRGRLTEGPETVAILQYLEAAGMADVALQWADAGVRRCPADDDMMRVLLLAHRRRIRTDLGLPSTTWTARPSRSTSSGTRGPRRGRRTAWSSRSGRR
jgi:hypothetical protein